MKRTNLVLFVLALGLFGYVTLVDRFGLSSGELDERKDRLVPALVRDRLVSITVERDGSRYSLGRGSRDADGNVQFVFETPLHVASDSERVDEALSTIEWAEAVRTLSGADSSDRRRFGLDRPRLRLRLEVGDRTIHVAFGADEPTGAGVYAEVDSAFYVVSTETRDAFDHPIEFFRVRRLAEVPADVDSVRLVAPTGTIALERTNGVFRLVEPSRSFASEGRVNVVLATARTLEATRFVDENPTDLARYGLDAPQLVVELGLGANRAATRIAIGGPCTAPSGSTHVRVDDGPVACVDESDLEPLFVGVDAYRELRASATEAGGVASLDLSDGSKTLSVRDEDGTLRFTLGEVTGVADPEAFEEWVEGFRAMRATEVRPLDPTFAPQVTLTVHRTGTRPDDLIRFQIRDGDVLGRRGDDDTLLVFPRSLGERLAVSTAQVRDRALLHDDPSTLVGLTLVRGSGTETLELVGDELRVVAPVAVAAESARVAELSARLAGLEAVRFVADSVRPEHGLDRPRFEVRWKFGGTPAVEHRLAIGAVVDGDAAYARLDGTSAVFVLVGATVDLVASPLASRQELSTESLYVDGITVKRGASTAILARDGAHFTLSGAPVDDERGHRALAAIADLRAAEVVAYGSPRPETGLGRPAAEIRVRRGAEAGDPSEVVLLVGATVGDADARRTFVRRADRNLVYLVDAASLSAVLALAD